MSRFQLQEFDPVEYRRKTRQSSFVIIVIFALLGMGCASLMVAWFGSPGGNNFRWNLLGVLLGLLITFLLVKYYLSQQPLMREAVYAWHLKRNLMRITNWMHRLKPLAENRHPRALQVLRFYHLAVEQMQYLEGDDSGSLEIKAEKQATQEALEALSMELDQRMLDTAWLDELKDKTADE